MRRRWLDIHRWVGLKLSILLSFVLITGTFATLSHEIDWLLEPARRVDPATVSGPPHDWEGMYRAIRAAYPDWAIHWLSAPEAPWFAAEAVGYTPLGERRRIYIHPGTLEVQGEGSWINAQRILRDSHRRLMIFNAGGIILVSSLGILLLISLVTGLVVYRKFWRGFFKKPRTRDARTFWGDLHRLGGVWSIWFVFLMGITALYYLVEAAGLRPAPLPVEERPDIRAQATPDGVSISAMADAAGAALPGFTITSIWPPHAAGEPWVFQGQTDTVLVRERANQVRIDPASGEVAGVVDSENLGAWQRVGEAADPLHFGDFAGLWLKLVYFVFGLILSGMALSGVYIYSKRIREAARKADDRRTSAPAIAEPAE